LVVFLVEDGTQDQRTSSAGNNEAKSVTKSDKAGKKSLQSTKVESKQLINKKEKRKAEDAKKTGAKRRKLKVTDKSPKKSSTFPPQSGPRQHQPQKEKREPKLRTSSKKSSSLPPQSGPPQPQPQKEKREPKQRTSSKKSSSLPPQSGPPQHDQTGDRIPELAKLMEDREWRENKRKEREKSIREVDNKLAKKQDEPPVAEKAQDVVLPRQEEALGKQPKEAANVTQVPLELQLEVWGELDKMVKESLEKFRKCKKILEICMIENQ
jgi:hypothetical protein